MKNTPLLWVCLLALLSFTMVSCSEEQIRESLQERLDDGELPEDLISKRKYGASDFHGLTFQGGIIYWISDEGETKILLPTSISPANGAPWGCGGTITGSYFNTTSGQLTTEKGNQAILNAGCLEAGDAARLAADYVGEGYEDWYLPSFTDLSLLQSNVYNTGLFESNGQFWLSDENDSGAASEAYYADLSTEYDFGFAPRDTLLQVYVVRFYTP